MTIPSHSLSALTHLYTTLSHPLRDFALKASVSRYRWDGLKTDWEKSARTWTVTRTVANGSGVLSLLTSTVTAQGVIEDILFHAEDVVSNRVRKLELVVDEMEDIPAVELRANLGEGGPP